MDDSDFTGPFKIQCVGVSIFGAYPIFHIVDALDHEFVEVFSDEEKANRLVRFLNALTQPKK